ncbi:TetR/AcrR family transcriptional regulator [Brevundimonas sp. S30B]|uniref:TetR/AcrR family transcriptional regulator n=1 Tax=unclassified Brevundimonas TaxID=2622653 RepID=UPI0010718426|nr:MULTISPECIES: TetR/AcrR family transcriptional regulator [unclassified Brevundimonas]QBX38230.1 TetR/AcrR family transcriptional regulator [Brevundimonas sp. MF30-B]TFW01633.1 TetR/AcrR family transcriptional regulator [Brevundimonas sp. S30B]
MSSPAPARSARKPKGEGHARRAEILEAAERIFVEYGYEGATIRKIAEAVGLSSTALYMHFADKDEILHEICRQAFETLIARNQIQFSQPMTPEAKLRLMLEDYVRFGFEQPNAYRLIYLTRPQEADAARSAAAEIGAELYRSFEAVVAEAGAAGRLRGEVRPTAQALWAGTHGVVSLMITKPYFDWVDRDTLTRTLLNGLFNGLLKS